MKKANIIGYSSHENIRKLFPLWERREPIGFPEVRFEVEDPLALPSDPKRIFCLTAKNVQHIKATSRKSCMILMYGTLTSGMSFLAVCELVTGRGAIIIGAERTSSGGLRKKASFLLL
jgi:hypothetical protein